ncbi:hypothetical protein FYK55_10200 [Roseiconus nitratireducens]|uniref:Uncharacterized protein n=1 Tax=Roseiconus nitratireducens TaxID=2605748 RepID=A0A5M6D7S5_9BACT|nr:hypothetical protein [Roseiconus nitratireducens]KAA5543577.1 hypothetical protein FYK55_10200 [Roseiconus nitratireducens]
MNTPESIDMLTEWMGQWRELCENDSTASEDEHSHLDRLGDVIAVMVLDFERNGRDATTLQTISRKHSAASRRTTEKRLDVLDELMPEVAKWVHDIEGPPAEPRYQDPTWARCFETDTRSIRRWRASHDFPTAPASLGEVQEWCDTNVWAIDNNKKLVEKPRT